MSTYLHSFDSPDNHGIDEGDAREIASLLKKAFPNEQFSYGVVNGVLGIRIEGGGDVSEFRNFVRGALATRHLWER